MADRRSAFRRLAEAPVTRLCALFPERQILVRDRGRIRSFRLGTLQQLTIVAAVAATVLWSLLSTAAYLDGAGRLASKEEEVGRKVAELNGYKASYQAAFSRLDDFQAVFASITCEITDIQDSLLRIAERNATAGKKTAAAPLPRLETDATGCRAGGAPGGAVARLPAQELAGGPGATAIAAAMPGRDTRRITGALKDGPRDGTGKDAAKDDGQPEQDALRRRVAQLDDSLARLKASHSAFIEHSAGLTALRVSELEKALSAVGVSPRALSGGDAKAHGDNPGARPFGRGGPFIAAKPGTNAGDDGFNPVSLFNSHADRLDHLTEALRALPLAEPLTDYEVTSPFGARNDPINNLSGIHEGVDLGAADGTPVMATGAGQVASAGWRDRYGMMVEIDHGAGLRTRYAHLSKIMVSAGQRVARGTILGLVGETGRTTGPHLHYEVRVDDRPTNPMKFIMAGRDVLKIQ